MFIRLNFAAPLETRRERAAAPASGPPGQTWPFTSSPHTYYMLITAIPKPRLQGVNLVGHYASLYFRVLCGGPLWGSRRGAEVRMRSWREMGEGCFMSRKGEGNRGGKSGKSTHHYYLSKRNERAGTYSTLWVRTEMEGRLCITVVVDLHSAQTDL